MINNERGFPELQFNVAQLLKEPTGAIRSYKISGRALGQLDEEASVVAPVSGEIKLLRTGPNILVWGTLRTEVQKSCGRCLTVFTAPIATDLEEEFFPTVDVVSGSPLAAPVDADEANRIDNQHVLDLSEVVRQGFSLESDNLLYCRIDCKGLCPHCGQDRNLEPCACQEQAVDLRWAGLLALQLDE